jgi:serine/threonine protein kinase
MNKPSASPSGTGRLPAEPFPRLGDYQLIKRVGLIGVAEVHLARRVGPSGAAQHVVLRRPRPDVARDPVAVEMFAREVRIAGMLHHPGIAQLVDTIELADCRCICLEHVPGESLEKLLERHARRDTFLAPIPALLIARATLETLEYAHGLTGPGFPHGIVHGDVCPANVVIAPDGAVKLLDFGMLKPMLRPSPTMFGDERGHLSYAAPERLLRQGIDGRADLWAVGLTLFEMLTNFRLFERRSKEELKSAVLNGPIPPADAFRADLPAAITAIISRALMRDIQQRYPSAAAMRADVEQALAAFTPDAIGQGPALLCKAVLEQPALAPGRADGGHETPALDVSPIEITVSQPAPADVAAAQPPVAQPPAPPPAPPAPPPPPQQLAPALPAWADSGLDQDVTADPRPDAAPARPRWPLAVAAVVVVVLGSLALGAVTLGQRISGSQSPSPLPLAATVPATPATAPRAAVAQQPVQPTPSPEPVALVPPAPVAVAPSPAVAVADVPAAGADAPAPRTRAVLRPLTTREAAVAFVRARSQLLGCFEQFSDSVASDQGEITLSVVVAQSGVVREAAVTSPPVGSPALTACIVERARKLRFRAHPDREVRINVPFVFRVRD